MDGGVSSGNSLHGPAEEVLEPECLGRRLGDQFPRGAREPAVGRQAGRRVAFGIDAELDELHVRQPPRRRAEPVST